MTSGPGAPAMPRSSIIPGMNVLIEHDGPVAVITIQRPEARNAVDPETAAQLRAAFADVERDPALLVSVLTGAGGHFCAGFDLKVEAGAKLPEAAPLAGAAQLGPMGPSRLLADTAEPEPGSTLSKPLIAAVEGYAVAGGLELALLADMRVASTTAVFGVYCRRLGRAADRRRDAALATHHRTRGCPRIFDRCVAIFGDTPSVVHWI